jgi:cation diffusion facilitator CzcD-associated flavoprotein CzcO
MIDLSTRALLSCPPDALPYARSVLVVNPRVLTSMDSISRISQVDVEIAVIGAGPYGLSVAAHLRANRLRPQVFGRVMSFWEDHMPRGMLVRHAASISDPHGSLSLDAYEAEQSQAFSRPLAGEEFAHYGHWFQSHAVPDVDERPIATLETHRSGFACAAEDGQRFIARRVVLATGLCSFAQRPSQFDEIEDDRVIHSVEVAEPDRFAGRSVVVIGSGQSAVETTALVREAGADVELIARAPLIRWLTRGERIRRIGPIVRRVLYAPTGVGPAGLSWIVAMPELFRYLPIPARERIAYRSIRPAATGWLVDRTADVRMTLGHSVTHAIPDGGGVRLTLDDGSERQVDRVILATGYRVDVASEPLIGESIRRDLRLHAGYPVLRRGYESSIAGLHFVGAYSAWSFGPVMRFVTGTQFTAGAVAEHVRRAARLGHPPAAP